jgi:lambda repressor-like predicted transcriptional regulator
MTDKSSADDERHYRILERLRELRYKWPAWGTLERAEAVVQLRNEGLSLRKLAKTAGCCEGTIRNYEFLGRAPWEAKQMLYDGQVSMRRVVQLAREAQKRVPNDNDDDDDVDDDDDFD